MTTLIQKFLADDGGATAIEYGLIAALTTAVIIVLLQMVAGGAQGPIDRIVAVLTAAT
jgi:Flp pilus assembly pilin Flp